MTTGRINQVAIGIAEAVRDDSGDRSTAVQSPACSSHESRNTTASPPSLRKAARP